jgi:formate hydrogenlyase subunit 3/multisubunit Na+/H+ antiporter MnhD subunit
MSRAPERASFFGMAGAVGGGAFGLAGSVEVLAGGPDVSLVFGQEVLFGGRLMAGVDPLSAFFLAPIFALGLLAAIYGRPYLLAYRESKWLGPPWFSFNLLLASMSAVVMARDGLTFLVAWEAMSLSAYALVSFEHEIESSRRAGWIYLLASHVALALLSAMFLMLARTSVSLEFASFAARVPEPGTTLAIFLLALAGFGIKAGLFPVHVWLPEAHAAAPSHVSALMSGVLIKMGVYGVLRTITLIGHQPWWGPLLMILGIVTGLAGIMLALLQRDMKRALAYSSVENIGIIFLGIGLGLFGLSRGNAAVAWLGFAGGLFHVWNHALMKGLLFLVAGSILHGAKTKDIERLGGVLKKMPVTGALMIGGAVAISALPPLNGFVSEWLIYLGLLLEGSATGISIALLLAVGFVALIGCLACFCFIRLTGVVLLGEPRSEAGAHAHESPRSMLAPMMVLLLVSVSFAVAPAIVLAPVALVIERLGPGSVPTSLDRIGALNGALIALVLVTALALRAVIAKRGTASDSTWGCGYAAPTARMQYTGRSFSELLSRFVPRAMRPKTVQPSFSSTDLHGEQSDAPIFAGRSAFSAETRDPLTRAVYEPFFERWASRFSRMRWLQQGVLHIYVAYIVVVLIAALAWMSLRSWSAS